jgi:glucose-6-phosphate isomerase
MLYNQELKNIVSARDDTKEKVREVIESLREEIFISKNNDMECVSVACHKHDLEKIKSFAKSINDNFKRVIVIGIGGSSLGAKTLIALKASTNISVLENIDDFSIKNIFNGLNLKETAFLVVSKSGKTIECVSQALISIKKVEDELGIEAVSKNFFFLTENSENPLNTLAKELNIKTIEHHKSIGGRFSFLSNTGLIPAAIAGLNIDEIRDGALDTINFLTQDKDNWIAPICASQIEMFKSGIIASVVMPYIDRLQFFTEWYRQLWAESLGKNGNGTIPINAMGTVDQHSQLQLYMDGPTDKFYTFIYREKDEHSLKIEKVYNNDFQYLKGMSLDDIMKIEFDSTIEVLNRRNLPIRIINFQKIDERSLSQLLMQYMLETIIIGKATNINPFGQPAVEERKILARNILINDFKK